MMKKYRFLLLLTLFVSQLMAQTIPSYVPTNGLVGWWPFNGNANDESGNGNNGKVTGATLSADRDGKLNGAYSFNGIGNFISIPNSSTLSTKDITINVWFKVSENYSSGNLRILSKMNHSNATYYSYGFGLDSLNYKKNIGFSKVGCNTVTGQGGDGTFKNVKTEKGIWYMYTGVITSLGDVTLYLNGKIIHKYKGSPFIQCDNILSELRLGHWWNGDNQWYNGLLDDISIHNRALTQEELTKLYNGNLCPQLALSVAQPTCFLKTGQVDILSPKGTGYSYSIDGINYKPDTIFYSVKPGTYNVSIKHTSGCANANSTSFTINPVPTVLTATTSPAGPLKICEGSSIKLTANTGKNYTYQWFKDKVAIQGATAFTYEAKKAGQYTVFVNDGACSNTSTVVTVDTIPLPDAPKINFSNIRVCEMMPREQVIGQYQIDPKFRWYRSETGNDSLQKYESLMPGYRQYYL